MSELDFSAMESALAKTEESLMASEQTKVSGIKLNTQELLADVQQQQKERELALKSRGHKQKKVERSKGYFDKLKMKDKTQKKAALDGPKRKAKK